MPYRAAAPQLRTAAAFISSKLRYAARSSALRGCLSRREAILLTQRLCNEAGVIRKPFRTLTEPA